MRKPLNPQIGQQLFSLGGAALGAGLGAFLGNPRLGLRLGRSLGGLAGQAFYARKSSANKERLRRQKAQTASLGEPIKRIYGTARIAGNVIWATDIEPYAVSGGEEYRCSFAVGFCAGVASKFLRIWANGVLIYSAAANTTGEYAVPPAYANKLKGLYLGTEAQTADPTIEAAEGAANVYGYKGLVYAVWDKLPLKAFGDQIPTIEAEITMASSQSYEKDEVSATISVSDPDMFLLSEREPRLFLFSLGVLTNVNRATLSKNQTDLLGKMEPITGSPSAAFNGKFAIDEEGTNLGPTLWFCAQDGSDTFLCKHVPGTLGFTSNYADKVAGEEWEIFVKGNLVFTADYAGAHIRCYNKETMARLWTKYGPLGPSGACVPGNFTWDNYGNLWLISWVDADPATGVGSRFFLTRITTGGNVNHYTFTGSGRCKNIAYDMVSGGIGGKLYAGGGDSNALHRLTCPSSGSPAITGTIANASSELSRACFLSQYRFVGGPSGSLFVASNAPDWSEVKISSFTVVQQQTLDDWGLTGTYGGHAYDPLHRSIWVAHPVDDKLYNCKLDRFAATAPTLGSVINSICQLAGLTAGEIDTTAAALASTTIRGFVIDERMSARDALESLLLAYHVDARENYTSGNIKLQFIQRTGASVASIAETELGAGEEEAEEVTFLIERVPEQTLPRRVTLRYLSYEREYDEAEVSAQYRIDTSASSQEVELTIPMVLTDDEAKAIVDRMLMALWAEANQVRLALTWKHCRLEAADPIVVTYNGDAYRIRLDTVEHGDNRLIEAVGVVELAAAYTSLADADDTTVPSPSQPQVPAGTQFFFLDWPCLRDSDDVPGPYGAVAPVMEGTGVPWPGATIYRSADALSWIPVLTLDGDHAVSWGYVTDDVPVPDFQPGRWDRDNAITIQMVRGTLASATEEELSADRRKNLLAVGSQDNGWEFIQFADLTDNGLVNGQRNYTVSKLLRGRFGSEPNAATHGNAEIVIVVDFETPSVFKIETSLEGVGETYYYKAVTTGTPAANVSDEGHIDTGMSLKPYAPSHPRAAVGWPTANDWTINWTRRARVGHDLQDYDSDIPLGEANERYEIDIRDSSSSALLRTLFIGPADFGDTLSMTLEIDGPTSKVVRAGSWITGLFYLGQLVDLSGFSNADNNGRFRVVALTATDMTLQGPRALVTEGSASGRRVRAASPAVTYTEAQQLGDGGVKGFFYYEIYQISDRLEQVDNQGRGRAQGQTT